MSSDYYKKLDGTILDLLTNQSNFCEIVKNCKGAYPLDIKISLERLEKKNLVIRENGLYKLKNGKDAKTGNLPINEETNELIQITSILSRLSKPHPADYDWRFTTQTVYSLLKVISKYTSANSLIGLFGVTTLYPIINEPNKAIKAHLYNKSASLINDLATMGYDIGLFNQDLFEPIINDHKYDLIIADPPWYNDFYKAFIIRAKEKLNNDGYLLLSVLPELTRPQANDDINYINQCCMENGFQIVEVKNGFLNYESPIFEQQSLQVQNFKCKDWRYGDLFIYQLKNTGSTNSLPAPITVHNEPVWDEYIFNNIKIKILTKNDESDVFSYEYADDKPLLGTVSRRAPVRDRISFWTSENLAFKVSNLKILRYLFMLVESGYTIPQAAEKTRIKNKLSDFEFSNLVILLNKANIYK